jgi:Uma2 family endonuclease
MSTTPLSLDTTLEVSGSAPVVAGVALPEGVMRGVTWAQYAAMLQRVGERRLRHTYDRGVLEVMSPSNRHEWESRFLGRLVERMAEELSQEVVSLGSWTLRRPDLDRGVEPDNCFYLASEPRVRGRRDLDLATDPPPDLAIEVDVANASVPRAPVYAAIGVPELWRYDGARMRFFELAAADYLETPRSAAFPFLPPSKLEELLADNSGKSDSQLVREFAEWVRGNRSDC